MSDANSVERIMEIAEANTDVHEVIHAVQDNADAIFTWTTARVNGSGSTSCMRRLRPHSGMPPRILTGRSRLTPMRCSISKPSCNSTPPFRMTPHLRSTNGVTRSGVSSATSRRSGGSLSSCTASRVPCSVRPRSWRRFPWIDAGEGWLREKFTEIGVIEFERMPDTGAEFIDFDINEDGFEERSADMDSAAADAAMGAGES